MNSLTLKSPAKINLYLKILNKRPDGFHNLETVFERISLYDVLTLTLRKDEKIRVICDNPAVPKGHSNLAFRAAGLLKESFNIKKGVDIKIKKHIPLACGLGGGSSNAVSVLLGLNRLWRLGLDKKNLLKYAKVLGSDAAFFIYTVPFALGRQRGDKITPLPDIKQRFWHLLVIPQKEIPAKLAYDLWDKNKNLRLIHSDDMLNKIPSSVSTLNMPDTRYKARHTKALTSKKSDVKIQLLALRQNSLYCLASGLFNSFTEISQQLCPDISEIKKRLKDMGMRAVSMSGKGPAVFGIASSRKEAIAYKRQLRSKDWSVFVVKTF